MRKAALFFTYLFNPLLIPSYTMLLLLCVNNPYTMFLPIPVKWLFFVLTFACTFLLPVFILIYMKRKEIISDFQLSRKEDRKLFYGILFLFYALLIYSFSSLSNHTVLVGIIPFSAIFVLIGLFISTSFFRLSPHVVSLSAVVAFFLIHAFLFKEYLLFFIFLHIALTGIMATAQLILQQYTNKELLISCIIGLISIFIAVLVYYSWSIISLLS